MVRKPHRIIPASGADQSPRHRLTRRQVPRCRVDHVNLDKRCGSMDHSYVVYVLPAQRGLPARRNGSEAIDFGWGTALPWRLPEGVLTQNEIEGAVLACAESEPRQRRSAYAEFARP